MGSGCTAIAAGSPVGTVKIVRTIQEDDGGYNIAYF